MYHTKVRFTLCLLLICCAAVVVPASAQHFQQITGSLKRVAVGYAEVWGLNGSQIYRFNPGTKTFGQIPGSFTQVAVGGGTLLQRDEVWGLDPSGHIFRFNFSTKAFAYVPGVRWGCCRPGLQLSQIAVGEGDEQLFGSDICHPYEVWGIDPASNMFRYNYCSYLFDPIPTPNPFTVIATGGGDVWGLDEYAQIWHYNYQIPAWTQATGGYFGTLQQIAVGVNDVWGLDGNGAVYRYNPTSNQFNLVQTPAATAATETQIAAGGNGVWALYTYGLGLPNINPAYGMIARWDSQIQAFKNEACSPAVMCGGAGLAQIAVGYGGGVWGVTPSGQVYAFVRP
jgi:Tectonin domain